MRAAVGYLLRPVVEQLLHDRDEFVQTRGAIQGLQDKMQTVEAVLFEKDEQGRMQLFHRIFDAIKVVDQNRITAE